MGGEVGTARRWSAAAHAGRSRLGHSSRRRCSAAQATVAARRGRPNSTVAADDTQSLCERRPTATSCSASGFVRAARFRPSTARAESAATAASRRGPGSGRPSARRASSVGRTTDRSRSSGILHSARRERTGHANRSRLSRFLSCHARPYRSAVAKSDGPHGLAVSPAAHSVKPAYACPDRSSHSCRSCRPASPAAYRAVRAARPGRRGYVRKSVQSSQRRDGRSCRAQAD